MTGTEQDMCTTTGPAACLGRGGFTVLEVTVALTIGAMALLGARIMLTTVADGADAIGSAARTLAHESNGERFLRSLVRQIETAAGGDEFAGDRHTARFTTWCNVPGGWKERCRAAIGVADANGELTLMASTSVDGPLAVRSGFSAGELRYIAVAARGGTWFEVWGEGLALPVAVAILLDGDTVILRVGGR